MNQIENQLSQIDHFQFIHEHLFISSQPTLEQLRLIKSYGIGQVINIGLSNAQSILLHEDVECTRLGLNYIQMPISFEMPSVEQCILVLDMMDYLVKEQSVWLHCNQGYKSNCLVSLYRQYYLDVDMPTAYEQLHAVWEPNETWTGLMHAVALQLQGRKATQELQVSLLRTDHFV